MDMPVVIGKTKKGVSGVFTAQTILAPGERKPSGILAAYTKMRGTLRNPKIVISDEVARRKEWRWDVLLIHEMIHAALAVEGYWYASHESKFQDRVREISPKFGYPIPMTDTMPPEELEHIEGKPMVLVTFLINTQLFVSAFQPGWRNKAAELKTLFAKRYEHHDMLITAYFIPASVLARSMTLTRTFPPDRYRINSIKDQLDIDLKTGQLLWSFNPKSA